MIHTATFKPQGSPLPLKQVINVSQLAILGGLMHGCKVHEKTLTHSQALPNATLKAVVKHDHINIIQTSRSPAVDASADYYL